MSEKLLDIRGALIGSGHKFRKEMLAMPVAALEETTKHMTFRFGVRGKETVGEASSTAEIRPYRTSKDEKNTFKIIPRTLETHLGDVVEEFDPYPIYSSVYGEQISKPRKDLDIVKAVAVEIAKQATSKLPEAIFSGVRNAAGDNTLDLFDGFDTICKAEKTAGNITDAIGNFVAAGEINANNVGDVLRAIFKNATSVLKKESTKLFVPVFIKEMYDEWFLANFGPVQYNTQFEQSFLHGTNKRCEIVDLPGMEQSGHIFLSTKKNMLIGVDQISDTEKAIIRECDNPKVVQLFMTAYFGAQFESLNPKRLVAASFSLPVEPEGGA